MILNKLENFFVSHDENLNSCFLALRQITLAFDSDISEHLKYGLPFYYYKKKPFCYFWKDKKSNQPYIGVVKGNLINHPKLYQGERKKMKIFPLEAEKDLPVDAIYEVFHASTKHYSS